ncbi:MAG: XRE family transcriptional regulator [Candidatus Sedimenticola sp. (ex Thyasira tokunagai)]
MSDWIKALRQEAARTSQLAAATLIGYSPSVVNQVLKGTYGGENGGDLKAVEESVRGAIMGATIDCPVIGEIPRNRCIDHQRRSGSFAATNPLRVQLHRHCPTCPNRRDRK